MHLSTYLLIVIFQMGNKWERAYKPPSFSGQSWCERVQQHPGKPEHGHFRVLVNSLTNEELQEHYLQFDGLPDFQRYLDFFGWRERQDSIVNAKYLNYEQGRQICGSSFRARVYIEHIPVRLSDIQDIPYPENLYVLLSALQGFEKLYQVAGSLTVSEDLICMDKDGRVKVWLNPDLSRCYPIGEKSDHDNRQESEGIMGKASKMSKEREQRIVEEIIRLVQENTTEDITAGMTVTSFIKLNQRGKGLTFKQAKQEILSYAERYQADIPNYFESVIGIFDEKPSQNDSLTEEPHFNNQPPREPFDREAESGHVSSHMEKVTNAHHSQTLNRIPSYEQMHRESERPGSAIYSLSHNQVEPFKTPTQSIPYGLPTGTVNMSNYKVSFNYQGNAQPVQQTTSFVQAAASPSMLKVKSASHLPNQYSFADASTANNESANRGLTSTSSLKNLLSNNKLVYSDSSTTYELDAEITNDMIKYLLF